MAKKRTWRAVIETVTVEREIIEFDVTDVDYAASYAKSYAGGKRGRTFRVVRTAADDPNSESTSTVVELSAKNT